MEKENKFIVIIILVILIIVFGFYYLSGQKPVENTNIVDNLNQDIVPNQENPVVQEDETIAWNVLNDSKTWFEVKYPSDFFDKWHEPKVLVWECNSEWFPKVCPNIDTIVSDLPASTSSGKVVINQVDYCLQNYQDAAMWHVYTYRYYTTIIDNKCAIIPIVTSQTNCDFYLPLEEWNTEQKANYDKCILKNENQPAILDKILSTFKFVK